MVGGLSVVQYATESARHKEELARAKPKEITITVDDQTTQVVEGTTGNDLFADENYGSDEGRWRLQDGSASSQPVPPLNASTLPLRGTVLRHSTHTPSHRLSNFTQKPTASGRH